MFPGVKELAASFLLFFLTFINALTKFYLSKVALSLPLDIEGRAKSSLEELRTESSLRALFV